MTRPPRAGNLLAWDARVPAGGWTRWAPRDEISPRLDESGDSGGTLLAAGRGLEYSIGGWQRETGPLEAGAAFDVRAEVSCRDMTDPPGSLWMRVYWSGDLPEGTPPEIIAVRAVGEGRYVFEDRIVAPAGARSCLVRVIYRWDPRGDAAWSRISMTPAAPERPHRVVRVATVYWRPTARTTVDANLDRFLSMIDKAAETRPDFILLPEGMVSVGVGLGDLPAVSETLPGGRFFKRVAEKARRHGAHVIYGSYVRDGAYIFNSAVLVGRDGALLGSYRKSHLPLEEDAAGLAPGNGVAVFDTDRCRVGMAVCYETEFPEVMRATALAGAEIIFVPIWGGCDWLVRARARENGVFVATSGFDIKCMIIDRRGATICETWKGVGDGVASAALDLDDRPRMPWLGDFPSYMPRMRRPELYGRIVEPRTGR